MVQASMHTCCGALHCSGHAAVHCQGAVFLCGRLLRENLEEVLEQQLPSKESDSGIHQQEAVSAECSICYAYRLPSSNAEAGGDEGSVPHKRCLPHLSQHEFQGCTRGFGVTHCLLFQTACVWLQCARGVHRSMIHQYNQIAACAAVAVTAAVTSWRPGWDDAQIPTIVRSHQQHITVALRGAAMPAPNAGDVPGINCSNPSCGKPFHRQCLAEWLLADTTTRSSFNTLFGTCPYCSDPITVRAI